jgi:hypothetical protein
LKNVKVTRGILKILLIHDVAPHSREFSWIQMFHYNKYHINCDSTTKVLPSIKAKNPPLWGAIMVPESQEYYHIAHHNSSGEENYQV